MWHLGYMAFYHNELTFTDCIISFHSSALVDKSRYFRSFASNIVTLSVL
jgi:hypothetical protein